MSEKATRADVEHLRPAADEEIARLRYELDKALAALDSAAAERDEFRSWVAARDTELAHAREERDKARAELAAAQDRILGHDQLHNLARATIERLTSDLAAARAETERRVEEAVERERERCAKLAEGHIDHAPGTDTRAIYGNSLAITIARAIRSPAPPEPRVEDTMSGKLVVGSIVLGSTDDRRAVAAFEKANAEAEKLWVKRSEYDALLAQHEALVAAVNRVIVATEADLSVSGAEYAVDDLRDALAADAKAGEVGR